MTTVHDDVLDTAFYKARTFNQFESRPVGDDLIKKLYDLLKWGPTAANCQPGRYVFLKSQNAKERLKPLLSPGNVEKTMGAPLTVIVATDPEFYDRLPVLYPAVPSMREVFSGSEAIAHETGFRSSSLQSAYLIIAARLLGLDCGPMSGFDAAKVDAEFFSDTGWRSNLLINLGYGKPEGVYPQNPRLAFEDVARIL